MALRIDYFRNGEKVMAVPCTHTLDRAREDAAAGLEKYDADTARILDTGESIKVLAVVRRD